MTDHQQVREALEPCPFCGGAPRSHWTGADAPGMEDCGYWAIECCDVHVHRDDEPEAIAAWNRRAPRLEAAAVPELSREDVVRLPLPFAVFDEFGIGADDRVLDHIKAVVAALVRSAPVGEVKPVATFRGRRLTPEGTSEFWGSLLCDQSSDPPIGALLYTSPPPSESPCQFAIDNGGNLYRRYREPVCAACVPAKKETDKWESARVADFNAGWNACRAAVLTTPPAPIEGWRMVPESALQWLFGEVGTFECPPERYFRGKPPAFWWRSVFRELIAAAPQPGDKP